MARAALSSISASSAARKPETTRSRRSRCFPSISRALSFLNSSATSRRTPATSCFKPIVASASPASTVPRWTIASRSARTMALAAPSSVSAVSALLKSETTAARSTEFCSSALRALGLPNSTATMRRTATRPCIKPTAASASPASPDPQSIAAPNARTTAPTVPSSAAASSAMRNSETALSPRCPAPLMQAKPPRAFAAPWDKAAL
mmetsp:Transcript_43121/g.124687  ORF Transcript_43121/g.124687 Transcript_43121/m.124687 type:complete len:206 (-) Transcript_43121:95-712(-)